MVARFVPEERITTLRLKLLTRIVLDEKCVSTSDGEKLVTVLPEIVLSVTASESTVIKSPVTQPVGDTANCVAWL